jgi:hypothetical protein
MNSKETASEQAFKYFMERIQLVSKSFKKEVFTQIIKGLKGAG